MGRSLAWFRSSSPKLSVFPFHGWILGRYFSCLATKRRKDEIELHATTIRGTNGLPGDVGISRGRERERKEEWKKRKEKEGEKLVIAFPWSIEYFDIWPLLLKNFCSSSETKQDKLSYTILSRISLSDMETRGDSETVAKLSRSLWKLTLLPRFYLRSYLHLDSKQSVFLLEIWFVRYDKDFVSLLKYKIDDHQLSMVKNYCGKKLYKNFLPFIFLNNFVLYF